VIELVFPQCFTENDNIEELIGILRMAQGARGPGYLEEIAIQIPCESIESVTKNIDYTIP
jgi:hypothetical protein